MSETIGTRGSGRTSWLRTTAMALVLGGGFVACDDEDPAGPGGDGEGEVEAYVMDDPGSAAPSVADRTALSAASAAVITGSFSGDARVEISIDGTQWVQLGSLSSIDVDLQSSSDEVSVNGEASVPVGAYTMVRLVLDGAAAEVLAGSEIGGIVLAADATVTVGTGGQIIVEKALQFTVADETKTRIAFDLNAEQWITQTAVTAGTAAEASVDASVAASASLVTQ